MEVKTFSPQKLNRLRLARGYSQDDLAYELRRRATNASAKQVARWEKGSHAPRSTVIPVLAAALNVEIEELYGPAGQDGDEEEAPELALRRIRSQLVLAGRDDLASDLLKVTQQLEPRARSVA